MKLFASLFVCTLLLIALPTCGHKKKAQKTEITKNNENLTVEEIIVSEETKNAINKF